ncbi:MAG: hypothetical protein K2M14_05280 [Muribaculaceae bacterium]|nr:hypothetical protein [Muribaculaceae bacterium]
MKKISILMALMMLVGLASTSCKRDTQPRIEKPTEFVLNTPPFAANTLILTEEGTFKMTCSQPNYGPAVCADYALEASIQDPEKVADPEVMMLTTHSSTAAMELPASELALAMCQLMGAVDEANADKYDPAVRPVWVRAVASVPGADYATVRSNWVKLDNVQPYFAVPVPGKLWLIGDVTGWDINNPTPEYILQEDMDAIGSKIYSGTFPIASDKAAGGFRFFLELGNWDNIAVQIGSAEPNFWEEHISLDADGAYSGACFWGQGNWDIDNHPGGNLKMTVDLNTMKVYFEAVD